MPDYLVYTFAIGGIAFVGGMVCLIVARHADQENYIIQKATPLPLSLVNVRDDVWLCGEARCECPLMSPHFGYASLHFSYKLEERVTEHYTDSKGNRRTRKRWKTRDRQSGSAVFDLVDGDRSITINGEDADFQHVAREVDRVGKWRHTLSYYPYPSTVNAVGSISEDKMHLEKYDNIPLIVTTRDRADYVEDSEKTEVW